MTALPMTVISGYLGAGKTTVLNRVLADPGGVRFAVLVNDFGDIAIDEGLIQNQDGDVIALSNGCVCCSIDGDLYEALDRLLSAPERPDHLVLEASGVADPAKLAQIAEAEPDLQNAGVLTLVDALNIPDQLDAPMLNDTVRRQIAAADQLALTKTDLLTSEALLERLETIAALTGEHTILNTAHRSARDLLPKKGRPVQLNGHAHAAYVTWSYRGAAALPLADWQALCTDRSDILRMKGHLNTPGGARYLVQLAGQHWTQEPAGPGPTELVVIGLKDRLSTDHLKAALP